MVKQFIGEIHRRNGGFRVFTTGDDKYLLFDCIVEMSPGTWVSTCQQFAVQRSRLKRGTFTRGG